MMFVSFFHEFFLNFKIYSSFLRKLQNLQALQHKNIVKFIGTCRDYSDNSILIVTEFVKYGNLLTILSLIK